MSLNWLMIIWNHSALSMIEKALQIVMDIVSSYIDELNMTKQDKETEKSWYKWCECFWTFQKKNLRICSALVRNIKTLWLLEGKERYFAKNIQAMVSPTQQKPFLCSLIQRGGINSSLENWVK
jgi:hypothetical protein